MKIFALALLTCGVFSLCMYSSKGSPSTKTIPKPVTISANSDSEEVYTGTIVNTNGRMVTTGFTLRLKGFTSDEDFSRYIGILGEGDQFDVLKVIKDVDLGSFIPPRDVGRQISVARKT
jgi:hypothetical protein